MSNSKAVYGIDLGTTYSCIAQIDQFDQAVVLRNFDGDSTTPSVVYFEDEGNSIVGKEAKGMMATEPRKTVSFIKREIGVDDSFAKPTKFPNGLNPVQISSLILKKLVKDANDASDSPEPITDVVITCPAYFGTKERMQTKQAGELAGLNVLAIINEPTAAAIAYGVKVGDEKRILVYDLGGGTFDVTMIVVRGGVIKVVATGGNPRLGGVDWDIELAEYMLGTFNAEHGTSYGLDSSPELRNMLLLEAELKKKLLTAKAKAVANISFDGKTSRIEITREKFEEITESRLSDTIDEVKKVLDIAKGKGFDNFEELILVGGSSKMPQIKARIDREFNCDATLKPTEADECVAKGAAVYAMNEAYMLAMEEYENDETGELEKPEAIRSRTNIKNVTSKTYGTDMSNNKVMNMVFANTSLPTKAVSTFTTVVDDQKSVSMKVYESDFTDAEADQVVDEKFTSLIDDKTLSLTKDWPKGTKISVIFELDNEGILKVSAAVEQDAIDFTLKITGVMSVEELAESKAIMDKINVE